MPDFNNVAFGMEIVVFYHQFAMGPKYTNISGNLIEYTYQKNTVNIDETIQPKIKE